ncbi:MAG: hypothetical protein JWO76_1540 [Nocardioides sp.]|nr:hypothetical protein [Nocardioides sp.]
MEKRRRHRWVATLPALLALAACGPAPSSPEPGPPAAHAATATVPVCRPEQVTLRVQYAGGEMSQPFLDVAIRNRGDRSCLLRGYPTVRARGRSGSSGGSTPRDLAVHHGLYERPDPGPARVVLRPGGSAVFSIGTATAYDGGQHLTLTRLSVALPWSAAPLALRVQLPATRPVGRPVPLGITAIAAPRHLGGR